MTTAQGITSSTTNNATSTTVNPLGLAAAVPKPFAAYTVERPGGGSAAGGFLAGSGQAGAVAGVRNTPHPTYRCFNCQIVGDHFKQYCPYKTGGVPLAGGIPVAKPDAASIASATVYQALFTANPNVFMEKALQATLGSAAPSVSAQGTASTTSASTVIPKNLQCLVCKQLLRQAVTLPCCGNCACDQCARNSLLEKNMTCPNPLCGKKCKPDSLLLLCKCAAWLTTSPSS
jgi:hypothetical protein